MTTTSSSSPGVASTAGARWMRRLRRLVLVLIAGLVLLLAMWTFATLSFTYSHGERAGFVQKFSKRGWVCKTWEGELAMVNLPGAMSQLFEFSVRDESVAKQINDSLGKRVILQYDQHKGIPSSCFGETEYFVTGVRVAEP